MLGLPQLEKPIDRYVGVLEVVVGNGIFVGAGAGVGGGSLVFNVLRASYFARHSLTLGSDVLSFGVAVGLGASVFVGGTRSDRYLARKASVERPLATIARSQASFVFVAARLYLATHSLSRASNETVVGVVGRGVVTGAGLSLLGAGGTSSDRYLATNASAESPLAAIARSQASLAFVAPRW